MSTALDEQVGGSHYKDLKMQPIELIIEANLTFIQGNIVKYLSRFKHKNSVEDLRKCVHYAKLGFQFHDAVGINPSNIRYAYKYTKINCFMGLQENAIAAAVLGDYPQVISIVKRLAKAQYFEDIEGL